jgi:hypothetical protein
MIAGQLPYEVPVTRFVPSSQNAVTAVLDEFFKGPGDVERNQGLAVINNGFTGYSRVEFIDGGVYVYLTGTCQSNGTLYTIERPLMANLKQFPEVQFVKIYDQLGHTRQPAARVDSVPACLDPFFTPSVTPPPTSTPRSAFSATPGPTATPTRRVTSRPTSTPDFRRTPTPLWTVRPILPTSTPVPVWRPRGR